MHFSHLFPPCMHQHLEVNLISKGWHPETYCLNSKEIKMNWVHRYLLKDASR